MDDTPSTFVLFGLSFLVMLAFVAFLWSVNTLPQKVRAIMSRTPAAPQSDSPGLDQSKDQSAHTSLPVQTTPAPVAGLNANAPDMDAENWQMPRISAYLNDNEFLVMIARQKTRGGQWRLSANQIVKLVGGDRTHILATIREVREGPAEYRPLTPEQQAARAALGLDRQEVTNGSS